jgi:Tfp pilus assembly protein PilV
MVATVIMGIAFTGVYTIILFSSDVMNASSDRQKMQLVADQIMEVIESDLDNIDSYDMNFNTCNAPDSGETQNFHQYRYRWCRMLNNTIGLPATNDVRQISISSSIDGKIVDITLENRNAETSVTMKRLFND